MMRLSDIYNFFSHPCEVIDREVRSFVLDSRAVGEGSVFFAVRGSLVDGHEYIEEARRRGAVLVIGTRPIVSQDYIQVPDVQSAMTALAQAYRREYQGIVITVTGSAGKTSIKEMCASVLRVHASVSSSPGNYNNEWGVPLAVLNAEKDAAFWVLEVGARHRGDIASLLAWLCPDVGMVSCVGLGHAEFMGGRLGVAACKYEMIEHLPSGSLAVARACDVENFSWKLPWPNIVLGRDAVLSSVVLGWGYGRAEVHLDYDDTNGRRLDERFEISLPQTGRHVLENALLVTAVLRYYGVPVATIQKVLAESSPVEGRGAVFRVGSMCVIDDAYNANPSSMRAALEQFSYAPEPRAAWLGDMLELGEDAVSEHRNLLPLVQNTVQVLCTHGPMMALMSEGYQGCVLHDPSFEEVMACLRREGVRSVLMKGSNSMGLSEMARRLRAESTEK